MGEEGKKVKVKKRKAFAQPPAAPAAGAQAERQEGQAAEPVPSSAGAAMESEPHAALGRQTTLNGDLGEQAGEAAGEGAEPEGEQAQAAVERTEGVPRTAEPLVEETGQAAGAQVVETPSSGAGTEPLPGAEAPSGHDEEIPLMEEAEPVAGEQGPPGPAPEAAAVASGDGAAAEMPAVPPEASSEESELQRLKKEFSDKLFELELDRNKFELAKAEVDALGSELSALSEELEKRDAEVGQKASELEQREKGLAERHSQMERREAELSGRASQLKGRESELALQTSALKKMESELSKRHEMVSAGIEAMNARQDELRQAELRLKQWEDEKNRVRQELESLRTELDQRQEKTRADIAALEKEKRDVEKLAADLQSRDEALRTGEQEHGKKSTQLEQARKELEGIEAGLNARTAELQKRFEEVHALEQHLSSIEEEMRLCPHCGAVEEFARLAQRGEQLKAKGEDTRELDRLLADARRATREGDYDRAAAAAREAAVFIERCEHERQRRDVMARIVSAESLARMLSDAKADVSGMTAAVAEAWTLYNTGSMDKAMESAEKARQLGLAVEKERFLAQDELASSGAVITALKKTGVNLHEAEKRKAEADRAMEAGDFKKARTLAAETMALASDVAQSQDVAAIMSQIKLADETLEELRSLGLDISEWERMVNRSRDFLKKLDFKSAEETARWARQKGRDAGRQYRHALMAIDHSGSVISTYKDMGLIVRKAEDLQDEAKNRLKDGDTDLAQNLARKAEKMVREIAERHKGAQAALKKAITTMRVERKSGRDITKGEKLYDLAQHQLELGEYANAMKLATKAAEAVTSASVALLELCPTCGEAIPENLPECPSCAEKKRLRKESADKGSELAQRSKLGSKGGRKYACPYCSELFEITVATRPITINCPWCGHDVSVVD